MNGEEDDKPEKNKNVGLSNIPYKRLSFVILKYTNYLTRSFPIHLSPWKKNSSLLKSFLEFKTTIEEELMMKTIFILISFLSFNAFSSNLKELCGEWQRIKLQEFHVKRWSQQTLLAIWMQSKGVLSSEFLIVSEKDQREACSARIYKAPIFEGFYVCEDKGFEEAEVYARRKAGLDFYNLIVPWGTDDKDKYADGCFSTTGGGLKNPSQKIQGKVGSLKPYKFYHLWTPYYSSVENYFHYYKCQHEDKGCIREAHHDITKKYLPLLKDFPEEIKETFNLKISAFIKFREAKWKFYEIGKNL